MQYLECKEQHSKSFYQGFFITNLINNGKLNQTSTIRHVRTSILR